MERDGRGSGVRVEVSVEVNDGDRAVDLVQRAENGKDNRVVSSERDELGMLLAVESERLRSSVFCERNTVNTR